MALPIKGIRVTRPLDRTGLVSVKCDIHGWMQAYIRVDPIRFTP
ncbi:MAG: hypothetical protein ACT4QD_01270 [Acidobacteriota bacterium]